MKITFLGTGAADWNMSEHKGWKGFRRNSSALIDDVLLIDPNGDVLDALETFNKDKNAIKYVINTHRHSDHFNENTLSALSATFFPLSAGERVKIGKYTVTALPANHPTVKWPVHFIIDDGKSKLFYGLDGAWLTYDEYVAIKNTSIDYGVFDATIGDVPGDFRIFEHNNLNMVLEMKHTLKQYIKRFCISHLARTLHEDHDVVAQKMKAHDVEVAYDGYETEF